MNISFIKKIFFIFFATFVFLTSTNVVFAQSVSELENQIKSKNNDIGSLMIELERLRSELSEINKQSNTLGRAVSELDATRKKLLTEIQITEDRIKTTNNSISLLETEIGEKETSINKAKKAIGSGIKKMNELYSQNIAYNILAKKSFTEAVKETNDILEFQKNLQEKVLLLKIQQEDLSRSILEKEEAKGKLLEFKTEVLGQKTVVEKNKTEKETLLKTTKNQESEYQKIITEKERLRAQFEAELIEFESRLSFILDPKSIPAANHGVFAWPLDNILITQGFGLTPDSVKLYSHRQGAWQGRHTGVDFRANNDPVKAMASGEVIGFGNTDTVCPRASFGGWVLIKYDNGLASIYSHLQTITATIGQKVKTGDIVAYSGNTGYSTGPHLDVKIVPASAVSIQTWPSAGCRGKNYTTPIVAGGTYLDPLLYLPKTTDAMWK